MSSKGIWKLFIYFLGKSKQIKKKNEHRRNAMRTEFGESKLRSHFQFL